jgi:hypothetical protein
MPRRLGKAGRFFTTKGIVMAEQTDFVRLLETLKQGLDAASLALAEHHGRIMLDDKWRRTPIDCMAQFNQVEDALAALAVLETLCPTPNRSHHDK